MFNVKFIALKACVRREESLHISYIDFSLKSIEKESRRKRIIMIRAEIREIEKWTLEKIGVQRYFSA